MLFTILLNFNVLEKFFEIKFNKLNFLQGLVAVFFYN
jgi:hypothetical protein